MSSAKIAWLSSVRPPREARQRTEWAERKVEEFLAIPFVSEFVFRNPRTLDGQKEHQAGDFLVLHGKSGILIQQKRQEDPTSRTALKVERWARNNAKAAWSQLRRGLTRPKDRPVWCDHPRQGRVEFPNGLPPIEHGLVIVEVFQKVNLGPDAQKLPLEWGGVPITYLSVSDFLNLAVNLRSVPELIEYLSARRSLPPSDRLVIGDEETLFEFFLLHGGSFTGCAGRSDASIAVAAQMGLLRGVLNRKAEADGFAGLLEDVMDALATRSPSFAEGLPPEVLAAYDPLGQRTGYRVMRGALAGLRLRERSELGRALHGAAERLSDRGQGFTFMTARFDSEPEWVYVLGSSKRVERAEVVSRMFQLMRGALAHYRKPRCLLIIDRDNVSYEVLLSKPDFKPTPADFQIGQRLFGNLRVTSTPLQLVPADRDR